MNLALVYPQGNREGGKKYSRLPLSSTPLISHNLASTEARVKEPLNEGHKGQVPEEASSGEGEGSEESLESIQHNTCLWLDPLYVALSNEDIRSFLLLSNIGIV